MKLRGNEEYFPKEIESKKIWSTMIIKIHIRNIENIKKLKER
jgi:hypothetical protein